MDILVVTIESLFNVLSLWNLTFFILWAFKVIYFYNEILGMKVLTCLRNKAVLGLLCLVGSLSLNYFKISLEKVDLAIRGSENDSPRIILLY